jgi:hypothetical protein
MVEALGNNIDRSSKGRPRKIKIKFLKKVGYFIN